MHVKTLIGLLLASSTLVFNAAVKADTCPKPEEFKEGTALQRVKGKDISVPAYYAGTSSEEADFMLAQKPLKFLSARFMASETGENNNPTKTGRLYSCSYEIEDGSTKLALAQAGKYKNVSILLGASSHWKKNNNVKGRYDCISSNTEDCQFTLN